MQSSSKRRFRQCGVAVLMAVAAFFAVLTYNALCMPSRQVKDAPPIDKRYAVDRDAAAQRLVGILTPLTIASRDADDLDTAPFEELHTLFERSFPLTHEQLNA